MHILPFHIASGHPAFAGHFPGMPITPGVVLLDEALFTISAHAGFGMQQCRINSVKFLFPVAPDTSLTLEYAQRTNGNIEFNIFDTQESRRLVASGVLRFGEPL